MLHLPKHRIPEGTFLREYMDACSDLETATDYDFWGGVWCIANAIGRSLRVERPNAPVYLNWYIILTADSGITRKSTAVSLANKVMSAHGYPQSRVIIEGNVTSGKLMELLHVRTNLTGCSEASIVVSELVRLLGRGSGASGLPGLLTDLYDCPSVQHVGGSMDTDDAFQLRNVFISLLSASTPAWLVRSINPNVIEGGFTSRTMFIVSRKRKRAVAWGKADSGRSDVDRLAGILKETIERAREVANNGITINDSALRRFKNWYSRLEQPTDPFRESFFSRQDAHVLRLAGCLCINDGSCIIMKRHIEAAIRIIHNVRESAAELFATGSSEAKVYNAVKKMVESLIDAGLEGIPRATLFARMRSGMSNRDFRVLIDVAHEMGYLQVFEVKGKGRPVTVFRGTKRLLEADSIERLSQTL